MANKRLIKDRASYQKPLGLFLNVKFTFKHYSSNTLCKANEGIAVIKRLRHTLPQILYSLFTEYF